MKPNFDLEKFEIEYNELFDEYTNYMESCEEEPDENLVLNFKERFKALDKKLNIMMAIESYKEPNIIKVIFGGNNAN